MGMFRDAITRVVGEALMVSGAQMSFETAAMGFDPSTGRTPIEAANNYGNVYLCKTSLGAVAKAAPGYLNDVVVTVIGDYTTDATLGVNFATHVVIYDSTAASGTILGLIPLAEVVVGKVHHWPQHVLFTTGLTFALCTIALNATTGQPEATVRVPTVVTYSIIVEPAFR